MVADWIVGSRQRLVSIVMEIRFASDKERAYLYMDARMRYRILYCYYREEPYNKG